MRTTYICLIFLFLLIPFNANAKVDFTNPISPSFISEFSADDLKKIESYILESAKKELEARDSDIKNRLELLAVLLNIYERTGNKDGLSNILDEVKNISAGVFDRGEEKLYEGLSLARLYTAGYRIKKDKIFKDRAVQILKEIEGVYFDNRVKAFLVDINGKRTVTSTANANAVIAFLDASREFKERTFEEIAQYTSQYLKNNLIKNSEAFHIFDHDKSKNYMDGQLIDNALTGIALLEVYKTLKDDASLETVKDIAGFMRERLYDEKFGGFIKRNSNTPENYPEGESIYISDKPFEENALAGYFFESIYEITGDKKYREIVKGTLGYLSSIAKDTPLMEQGYFIITAYNYLKPAADVKQVSDKTGKFGWETKLPNTRLFPLIVLSFLAGVLSFLSPCTLPILPAYFAFTFQGEKSRIIAMTFFFFLGLAFVFSTMGATASFIGSFLQSNISIITTIGGILIIIFGFMSLIGKGFSGAKIFQTSPSATLGGSFLFGCMMAFGWTACVGPILAGILVLAATEEGVIRGIVLLFIYALGLGLPLMTISLFFKNMDRNGWFWRFLKGKGFEINIFGITFFLHSTSIISGIIFISLGVLMLSGYLVYINKILPLSTQVWFADIEDKLMEMFK